jgi:sulfur-carrier protein adenylyltransferase/sulfurtransferase
MTYKTGKQLIEEAKEKIQQITAQEAEAMQGDGHVTFLDIREPAEWNLGHLPKAVHLPRGQIEGKLEGLVDRSQKIVLYCHAGNRSALAAETLGKMGYDAVSLAGGIQAWAEYGGEIED